MFFSNSLQIFLILNRYLFQAYVPRKFSKIFQTGRTRCTGLGQIDDGNDPVEVEWLKEQITAGITFTKMTCCRGLGLWEVKRMGQRIFNAGCEGFAGRGLNE